MERDKYASSDIQSFGLRCPRHNSISFSANSIQPTYYGSLRIPSVVSNENFLALKPGVYYQSISDEESEPDGNEPEDAEELSHFHDDDNSDKDDSLDNEELLRNGFLVDDGYLSEEEGISDDEFHDDINKEKMSFLEVSETVELFSSVPWTVTLTENRLDLQERIKHAKTENAVVIMTNLEPFSVKQPDGCQLMPFHLVANPDRFLYQNSSQKNNAEDSSSRKKVFENQGSIPDNMSALISDKQTVAMDYKDTVVTNHDNQEHLEEFISVLITQPTLKNGSIEDNPGLRISNGTPYRIKPKTQDKILVVDSWVNSNRIIIKDSFIGHKRREKVYQQNDSHSDFFTRHSKVKLLLLFVGRVGVLI